MIYLFFSQVVWNSGKKYLTITESDKSIQYTVTIQNPNFGYIGSFIQFSFNGIEDTVNQFTTETNVIPETLPFPDCTLESCYGKLV